MEAIVDNNNFFSNLDFFHNIRDHSKKDLKTMRIKKTKNRGDILPTKQYERVLKSNVKSGIPERKLNNIFGTDVPVSNYVEKVMGFYGYVLHHIDITQSDEGKRKFIGDKFRQYNQLLKDQANVNLPRSEFIAKLEQFSRSFLDPLIKKTIGTTLGVGVIKTDNIDKIIAPRLRDLKKEQQLKEGQSKGRRVKRELEEERAKRNQLQNILNSITNENIRQKRQDPLFKKVENIVPEEIVEGREMVDLENNILKALREQKTSGTVASLSGFLGITTASIIARIIGNSTANYLSPNHKSSVNVAVGNNRDDKKKLIELIQKQRIVDTRKLKNDIKHLRDRIENKKNVKNIDKRKTGGKRKKMHSRFNRNEIQLINVINKI